MERFFFYLENIIYSKQRLRKKFNNNKNKNFMRLIFKKDQIPLKRFDLSLFIKLTPTKQPPHNVSTVCGNTLVLVGLINWQVLNFSQQKIQYVSFRYINYNIYCILELEELQFRFSILTNSIDNFTFIKLPKVV